MADALNTRGLKVGDRFLIQYLCFLPYEVVDGDGDGGGVQGKFMPESPALQVYAYPTWFRPYWKDREAHYTESFQCKKCQRTIKVAFLKCFQQPERNGFNCPNCGGVVDICVPSEKGPSVADLMLKIRDLQATIQRLQSRPHQNPYPRMGKTEGK